jgi:hypothetical protein
MIDLDVDEIELFDQQLVINQCIALRWNSVHELQVTSAFFFFRMNRCIQPVTEETEKKRKIFFSSSPLCSTSRTKKKIKSSHSVSTNKKKEIILFINEV